MPNRIVHIGFPKTATTFLQWEVFPCLEGVNYIDYDACRAIFPEIVTSDKLDCKYDLLRMLMKEYEDDREINLFSFESLSGSPYALKGMNRSAIAEGLKEVGVDRILITVRNQVSAIDSYYRQYVVHGGTLRFRNWIDIQNERPWMHKHFNLSYLKYDLLVSYYYKLFGKANVMVVDSKSFRDLKSDQFGRMMDFLGAKAFNQKNDKKKVNASLTNLSTALLRTGNYFTYNTIRPSQFLHDGISTRKLWLLFKLVLDPYLLKWFSSTDSYVDKYELSERIGDYYFDSNQRLFELTGVQLNK